MDVNRSQIKTVSLRKITNKVVLSDKRGEKKRRSNSRYVNSRYSNTRIRRCRANARERDRMHCLNAAMDNLRKYLPIGEAMTSRLSKIETLRMARNYIAALSRTLECGQGIDVFTFAKMLSFQMSSPTIHSIADNFKVDGSLLCKDESKQISTLFMTSFTETVDAACSCDAKMLFDSANEDFSFGLLEDSQQSLNSEKDCMSVLALSEETRERDSELIRALEDEVFSFPIGNNVTLTT